MIPVDLVERIRRMARSGLGFEDIAVTLKLLPRQVRPFVIGDRHDNQRASDTAAVRAAQDRDG